jgi:hypothetical protein
MGFKKGTSGNINGKPRGASNHTTKQTKELIANLLQKEFENIEEYKSKVTPNEWLQVLVKLVVYTVPKQAQVETTTNEATFEYKRLFE